MSTRFYFGPRGHGGMVMPTMPPISSGWELNNGYAIGSLLPELYWPAAPFLLQVNAPTISGTPDQILGQFVSGPLPAGTLDGQFSIVLPMSEGDAASNTIMQVIIRVVSNDGQTLRGTAYAGQTATVSTGTAIQANYELPTTASGHKTRFFDNVTLTPTTIQAGDRVVVEVGVRWTATVQSQLQVYFNEDVLAQGDYELVADRPHTALRRPWVEFTKDLLQATLTREQFRYTYTGVVLNTDVALPFVDLTKVDGLDNAPVALAQHQREGAHGGYVISPFQGARTVTLEGDIYASASALETYLDTLKENFKPTLNDHPLLFGTDSDMRMVYGKSQGLRYAKESFRRLGRVPFQVQIVCADPRIYGPSPLVSAVTGTAEAVFPVGNREQPVRFALRGAMTNPTIQIDNLWGTRSILYTGTLTSTDVLVIDTDLRTAILNYTSTVRRDLTITNNWPVLVPGRNTFAISGSGGDGSMKCWMRYQGAYE